MCNYANPARHIGLALETHDDADVRQAVRDLDMSDVEADAEEHMYNWFYELVLDGWTEQNAWDHIHGDCDRTVCTGDHVEA